MVIFVKQHHNIGSRVCTLILRYCLIVYVRVIGVTNEITQRNTQE